jgi:ATP-binding cassette subfamily C protein
MKPAADRAARPGERLIHEVRRRFVRMLAVVFVITTFVNLMVLATPLYGMGLFSIVLTTRNLATFGWLALAVVLALGLYAALEYVRALLQEGMADEAERALSLPTLLAAARAGSDEASASLSGEAVRDLGEVRRFLASPFLSLPLDLAWSPVLLAVLLAMHWGYALLGIACMLILGGLSVLGEALTRRPLTEANDEMARSLAEISVALRGAEAVTGLGMLPALARRWRRGQDVMLAKLWAGNRTVKATAAATKALRLSMTGAMVCLGLVLCIDGLATPASMIAANMILARLLMPFDAFVSRLRAWSGAAAAWRRLRALLTETVPERGTLALPCRAGHVVVDRLVYIPRGSERPVLRGVSFEIRPGEILGVIGPSGAGKSSLARLVLGILQPTAGGVWLDGSSTWAWERGDFGRHVGFMPQSTVLVEGTIAENITRLRDAPIDEVMAAARRVGLHETIMRLPHGYATRVGDAGFVLSGGQRQRLALARALHGNPRLLVLDEPNANLDDEGERAMLSLIAEAAAEGTSVLMIAQRPSLVAIADKLLVLRDGMIDRFGAREAILKAITAPPVQLVRQGRAEPKVASA